VQKSFYCSDAAILVGIVMDAFEVLMEEHGIILKAISILEQSAKKELPTPFYSRLLGVITDFADRCHHGKEETALFPVVKLKDANQSENIANLLEEHEKGRSFIAAIRQAIEKNDAQSKVRNADNYYQLLTAHIRKENELFVTWFRMLSVNEKDLLFEKFEEIEEKVIGIGKHEEYVSILESMQLQVEQTGNLQT
jgi:hemerythrin-like domain-containing protein